MARRGEVLMARHRGSVFVSRELLERLFTKGNEIKVTVSEGFPDGCEIIDMRWSDNNTMEYIIEYEGVKLPPDHVVQFSTIEG